MSYPPYHNPSGFTFDNLDFEEEERDAETGSSTSGLARERSGLRSTQQHPAHVREPNDVPQMPMEWAGSSAPTFIPAGFDTDPNNRFWGPPNQQTSQGPALSAVAQVASQNQPIGHSENPLDLTGQSYHTNFLPQVQDASISEDMRPLIGSTKRDRDRIGAALNPRFYRRKRNEVPLEYWEDPNDPDPRAGIDDHPRRKRETITDWKVRVIKSRRALGIKMKPLPPQPRDSTLPDIPSRTKSAMSQDHRRWLLEDAEYKAKFFQEKAIRHAHNKRIDDELLQKVREWQLRRNLPREPTPDSEEDSGEGLFHDEFDRTMGDKNIKRCKNCSLVHKPCTISDQPDLYPCELCKRGGWKCERPVTRYRVRGDPREAGEPYQNRIRKGKPSVSFPVGVNVNPAAYQPGLAGNAENYRIGSSPAELAAAYQATQTTPYRSIYRSRTPPGASRDGFNPSRQRIEVLPADRRTTTETPRRRRSRSPLHDRPTDIGRLPRDFTSAYRQTYVPPTFLPDQEDGFGATEDDVFGDLDLYTASPIRGRPAHPAQVTLPIRSMPSMVLESGARVAFGACKYCVDNGFDCEPRRPCGFCQQLNLQCDELMIRLTNFSTQPNTPVNEQSIGYSGQEIPFQEVTEMALATLGLREQVESQRANAVQPMEIIGDGAVNLIAAAQQPAITTNQESQVDLELDPFYINPVLLTRSLVLTSPRPIVSPNPTGFANLVNKTRPLNASQDSQNLTNETGSQFHATSVEQNIVPNATSQDLNASGGNAIDFMDEMALIQPITPPRRGGAEQQFERYGVQRRNGYMQLDFYDLAYDESRALKAQDFLVKFLKWKPGTFRKPIQNTDLWCVQDRNWYDKAKSNKTLSFPYAFCHNIPSAKCETTDHESDSGRLEGLICNDCHSQQECLAMEVKLSHSRINRAYMCTPCASKVAKDGDILRGNCACQETMDLNLVCNPHFESGWKEISIKGKLADDWLLRTFAQGQEKCLLCVQRGPQPSSRVFVCKACHSIVKDWNQ